MSEAIPQKNKRKNIFQFLMLILILIILPAGSWYYLKKGLDFRRENIRDLDKLGVFETKRDLLNTNLETVSPDSLKGKMIFAVAVQNFGGPNGEVLKNQFNQLDAQFKNRNDTRLLFLMQDTLNQVPEWINSTTKWVYFAPLDMQGESMGLDFKNKSLPCWVLIDDKSNIRKYYQPGDFEKLVLQSGMIAPGKTRESIELKREKEN